MKHALTGNIGSAKLCGRYLKLDTEGADGMVLQQALGDL